MTMRYLMLVRVPDDARPTPQQADPSAWHAEAVRRGQHLTGERLRPPSDATTVRRWGPSLTVTHGPFVELAEHIVGFDLLQVDSAEEAVALAAGHPVAGFGALELRELWPHDSSGGDWVPTPGETDGDLRPGASSYVLLMAGVPGAPAEAPAGASTMEDWIAEAERRDADRGGSPLRGPEEAVTVRVREGRTLMTHGPYAELAEQVYGYQLLDVPDLDAALELAGAHPAAGLGAIEIRPLWPM